MKCNKVYEAKVKKLHTSFADMKEGQKMAIGTPSLILELTKGIPRGKTWTLLELRQALAKKLKAHVACPVTTSMFLRIGIENEISKDLRRYKYPFWRVVDLKSPLFKKLSPKAKKLIKNRLEAEL